MLLCWSFNCVVELKLVIFILVGLVLLVLWPQLQFWLVLLLWNVVLCVAHGVGGYCVCLFYKIMMEL